MFFSHNENTFESFLLILARSKQILKKPLLSRLEALALLPLLKAIQEILFKANFAALLKRLLKPLKERTHKGGKKKEDSKLNCKN